MENNYNLEEIEEYLNGNLKGNALKDFEAQLQSDKALTEQVSIIQNMDIALADEDAINLQTNIQNIGDQYFENSADNTAIVRRMPFYRRPLFAAASMLLLISFAFLLWWQSNKTFSNSELYASYYQPYSAAEMSRSESGVPSIYDQAIEAYGDKKFSDAISLFQQSLVENPNNQQAHFALAQAYLNQTPPDYNNATIYFQKVIAHGKSILVTQSQWYQALIYLNQNNESPAKELLTKIQESEDDVLAKKAKELVGKIKE